MPHTPHTRCNPRRAAGLSLIASCLLAGLAVAQDAAPTQPSTLPSAVEAAPPPFMPVEVAATVDDALAYTPPEWNVILPAVHDGDGQVLDTALYVLLRRAAMLPVARQTLDRADDDRMDNLLAWPRRYRGHLVRLEVQVWRVRRWHQELSLTPWWANRPAWRFDCTDRATGTPLIVFLTHSRPTSTRANSPAVRGPRWRRCSTRPSSCRPRRPGPGEPGTRIYPLFTANAVYGAESTGTAATAGCPWRRPWAAS